ncbi:hypothetical protein F4809DRAFT_174624 [Biscogniauxia mediterranea]|nr:hypothetical protein F4809DRAFT_174624 [Biscogniauxia mediterranea]
MADHHSGTAEYHLVVDKSKAPLFEALCRLLNEGCDDGGHAHIEEMRQQHPDPHQPVRACCCCCFCRPHHETSHHAWLPPRNLGTWAPPNHLSASGPWRTPGDPRMPPIDPLRGPIPIPEESSHATGSSSTGSSSSSDLGEAAAARPGYDPLGLYARSSGGDDDDDDDEGVWGGFNAALPRRPRPFPRPIPPPPPYPNPPKGRANYAEQMDDTAQAMWRG